MMIKTLRDYYSEDFDKDANEVVIDKKYMPKKMLELFNTRPIVLSPWDPMGALAR